MFAVSCCVVEKLIFVVFLRLVVNLSFFCVVLLAVGKFQELFLCLVVHVRVLLKRCYLSR